jgi:hypothetical protein
VLNRERLDGAHVSRREGRADVERVAADVEVTAPVVAERRIVDFHANVKAHVVVAPAPQTAGSLVQPTSTIWLESADSAAISCSEWPSCTYGLAISARDASDVLVPVRVCRPYT